MKANSCLVKLIALAFATFINSSGAADPEAGRLAERIKALPMSAKVKLSEEEWRKVLTPAEFLVLRQGATEPAFDNAYASNHAQGIYLCAGCGNELFSSATKFDSGTGWPSFTAPLAREKIALVTDRSGGLTRQEVRCARCSGHLGHLFKDGPPPTRLRYCLNSAALRFTRSSSR